MDNLAKKKPGRLKAMIALWDQYAKDNGVVLTGDGPFAEKMPAGPATAIDQ